MQLYIRPKTLYNREYRPVETTHGYPRGAIAGRRSTTKSVYFTSTSDPFGGNRLWSTGR